MEASLLQKGKELKNMELSDLSPNHRSMQKFLLNTMLFFKIRLRQLQVMKEGIQLPTNVVVGDQSSGKSSVIFYISILK